MPICTRRQFLTSGAALVLVSGGLPSTGLCADKKRAIVMVVSKKLRITDVSEATLRRIFRRDTSQIGDKRVIPFNYAPDDPLRRAVDAQLLGMSKEEAARYWIERRIRGQGKPPKTVPSPAVMRAVAEKLVGAIGYLLEGTEGDAVQVLTIDGVPPSSSDYPLKVEV